MHFFKSTTNNSTTDSYIQIDEIFYHVKDLFSTIKPFSLLRSEYRYPDRSHLLTGSTRQRSKFKGIKALVPLQKPNTDAVRRDYVPAIGDFVVFRTGNMLDQIMGIFSAIVSLSTIYIETRDRRAWRAKRND